MLTGNIRSPWDVKSVWFFLNTGSGGISRVGNILAVDVEDGGGRSSSLKRCPMVMSSDNIVSGRDDDVEADEQVEHEES